MALEPAGVKLVAENAASFANDMAKAAKAEAGVGTAAQGAAAGVEALAAASVRAAKIEELNGGLAIQQKQLAILQQELTATSAKYGESSIQAQKKQLSIDKLSAAIAKVQGQIAKERSALDAEVAAQQAAAAAAQQATDTKDQAAAASDKVAKSANKEAEAANKAAKASDGAAKGIAKIASESGKANSGLSSLSGGLGRVAKGLGGLAMAAGAGVAAVGVGLVGGLGVAAAAGLGFNNSLEQASARIQAFTKDSEATAAVLDMVRQRAAETPFAFNEMADAAAALGPVAKSSGKDLEGLIAQAEILAASNPAEGLAGAAFALREAASGDFTSIIERFNLSRVYINKLKDEGVPALEAVGMALKQAGYDADLVTNLANTASGRLSTLTDTFTNLAGIATKPFFDTFSSSLGDVNKILSDNAPLLEQAAAGLGQILAPAAQMLGDMMRGAATGLVTFAKNLPSIAQQAGRVAGVLMAVASTAKQWWGALSPLLGQALSWGANFIGQLAKGMLDAASVVLSALMQIGAIITSWLAPGSPPKLLPDLPDWGTSAVNEFMKGWATPDLGAFDTLAGTIEGMLRDLVPTGQTDEGGVLSMIFGSRDAIARAVEEFRTLGSVSEESFGAIRDAAGPAGESAERFARAYFEVEEASREVAKAQEDVEEATRAVDEAQRALNDTLSAFDAILNPLNKQLQGIQDRKDEIKDAQRIAELQEELASGKLDEQEAELARLEIAEIQTEQQIRSAEREKEAAAEAAQANLDAAEEAQTAAEGRLTAAQAAEQAAQAQLEREQASIGLQSEQNRLIGEQISLLEKLAQAASKGAGGAGAGLPDVGAVGGQFQQLKDDISSGVAEINEVFAGFQQGMQEIQSGPLVQQIQNIGAALSGIPGNLSTARSALDTFFSTPLGTEIQQGAGVVAAYFQNDFPRDLENGIAAAERGLNRLAESDFGQRLQRGAGVVAEYMVNDWPADFQRGVDLVVNAQGNFVKQSEINWNAGMKAAGIIATYILNEWPKDFENGVNLVVDFVSKLPERAQTAFDDFKKSVTELPSTLTKEAEAVGTAIAQGIADGISSAAGRAIEAARRLASSLPEWVRKVLGIASPSKVMAALGLNAGDSFASGILEAIPAALDAAQALAEETRDKVIKELERLAKDVQTFVAERLSGRIGLVRSTIGGLDALKDAQRALQDLEREQIALGNEVAAFEEEQAARRREEMAEILEMATQVDKAEAERRAAAEASAKKIADLEAERAQAAITAAQNLDPEQRQKALERMAEIDAAIEQERADAAAKDLAFEERKAEIRARVQAAYAEAQQAEIEAAERLNELERERAEIGRQIMIAAEKERYIREQTALAQAAAAKLAETDPVFAQTFLARRQSQISELADLRAELASTGNVDTRAIIQEQIRLLEAAMALELEQLEREGAQRAEEIARLGQPGELGDAAGDEFLAKFGQALGDGAPQLAAGLIAALQTAFTGLTVGLAASLPGAGSLYSPIASPGSSAAVTSTSYGDQSVTINAAGFTVSQLKAVIREVMSEQARGASTTARGTA